MEYKPIKNVTMKRILFILFAAIMSTTVCHAAMSNSRVRKETRFLTDKMAYELKHSITMCMKLIMTSFPVCVI